LTDLHDDYVMKRNETRVMADDAAIHSSTTFWELYWSDSKDGGCVEGVRRGWPIAGQDTTKESPGAGAGGDRG